MPTLDELHPQIDQGKTIELSFRDNDENVKITIKNEQGRYVRTISYTDRPNPFPQPKGTHYATWRHLLEDLIDVEKSSEQWRIVP